MALPATLVRCVQDIFLVHAFCDPNDPFGARDRLGIAARPGSEPPRRFGPCPMLQQLSDGFFEISHLRSPAFSTQASHVLTIDSISGALATT
jgi:hypothetical protein